MRSRSALDGQQAAVRLIPAHPFARGFAVGGADLAGDILRLEDGPGEHETSLAVRTDYGLLPGRTLRFTVA